MHFFSYESPRRWCSRRTLRAWSNTILSQHSRQMSNLGDVPDGGGPLRRKPLCAHGCRSVSSPSWWVFSTATARSTTTLRVCLQLSSRLSFFVCFRAFYPRLLFLRPPPTADAHQVAQAYPQLASKELTFGFKVIYKDLVRTMRFSVAVSWRNSMTGCS